MDILEEILRLDRETKNTISKRDKKIEAIKEKIIKKEVSTGDNIKDFLIIMDSLLNQEMDGKLRLLKRKINNKQGEQVLVDRTRLSKHGKDGCFTSSYEIEENEELRIGVIKGELDFDLSNYNILIPTEKQALKGSDKLGIYNEKFKLVEGPISIRAGDIIDKHSDLTAIFGYEERGHDIFRGRFMGNKTRIILGNDDVELYFKLSKDMGFYEHLDDMLSGKMDKNSIAGWLEHYKIFDLSYVDALNALGLDIPGEFKTQYDDKSYKRKIKIIEDLEKLTKEEEASFESKNNLTYDQRQNLKSLRTDIVVTLMEAIELNMDKEKFTLKKAPGVTMEVSEYISALFKKYEDYKIEIVK